MIITKVYQSKTFGSIGISLTIPDGGNRYVSFGGGSRYLNQKSTFTTSDKKLQEAMEKSSYFGNYYTLLKTMEIPEQEDIKKEQSRYKNVYLKNNNAARAWFKETLPEVPVSYLRNQQALSDKAKEYGYVLVFENAETQDRYE